MNKCHNSRTDPFINFMKYILNVINVQTLLFSVILLLVVCIMEFICNCSKASEAENNSGKFSNLIAPSCQAYMVNGICHIEVSGHTNLIAYRPLQSQAYVIRLYTYDGIEIQKTFYGRHFGLPLNPDKSLLDGSWKNSVAAEYGHSRIIDFNNYANTDQWFADITNSFRIKEPGTYRLKVQLRLFVRDTNNMYQPFLFPPVETIVRFGDKDLH